MEAYRDASRPVVYENPSAPTTAKNEGESVNDQGQTDLGTHDDAEEAAVC